MYGYKRGIEPTFVRLFHGLSGEDIPVTIGLYHDSHFKQVMQYKTIFRIIDKHNRFFFPYFASLFNFISYMINENITNVILYGIPNSLYLGLFTYYFANIMIFQLAYFYYLCKYLKLKLKNLNKELYEIHKNKRFTRIHRILWSFNALYSEIDEYNTTYWSKFLLIICLFLSAFCVLVTYNSFFSNSILIIKIISMYSAILGSIMFNFIFTTASSLNSEANNTCVKLHSLNLQYVNKQRTGRNLRLMIKVNYY